MAYPLRCIAFQALLEPSILSQGRMRPSKILLPVAASDKTVTTAS